MLEVFTEITAYLPDEVLNDLDPDLKTLLERNNIDVEIKTDEDDRQFIRGSWKQVLSVHDVIRKHLKPGASVSSEGSKSAELILQGLCLENSNKDSAAVTSKTGVHEVGEKLQRHADCGGGGRAEKIVPDVGSSRSSDEGENTPLLQQAIQGNIERGYLRTYAALRDRLKRDRRMDSYFQSEPRYMHRPAKHRRTDTNVNRGGKREDLDKELQELEEIKEMFDLFDMYELYSSF